MESYRRSQFGRGSAQKPERTRNTWGFRALSKVKRQGLAAPSWQRCAQGLFLDRPHLLLTEHQWDQEAQTSSTHFWTIEENGTVMRFGSQMTAWRDEAYLQLLTEGGFYSSQRVDPSDWPASDTFAGKLFVLLNQIM